MKDVLVSWIGGNDLQAHPSHPKHHNSDGPLLSTLKAKKFTHVYLLYNYPDHDVTQYLDWVRKQVNADIVPKYVNLLSPIDFSDIYKAANATLNSICHADKKDRVSILLSPGTPAMQAVWILLGKTRYPVKFIQSSIEQGVKEVELPFDIAAEFLPELASQATNQLAKLMANQAPSTAEFDTIISQNSAMQRLKERAAILSTRDVPVLIQGETGTGKELFARAIHNTSPRAEQAFIPVNCGAIPRELIDSTLFGHTKGSFTGAIKDHQGVFEQANGGTLFLDEFGDLPADAQVRLLRVLQESKITRVGDYKERKIDVRIIAATHKDLSVAIANNEFREDLYYRVAIGVLQLPPLRDREGDLIQLSEKLLEQINQEASNQPGYKDKKLSLSAKKIILNHVWPGNIRELHAVLLRASLWSGSEQISDIDIEASILNIPKKQTQYLDQEIGNGFNIHNLIDDIERHYVQKAWQQSGQRKKQAAELLGYNNYQTFDKRLKKLGLDD